MLQFTRREPEELRTVLTLMLLSSFESEGEVEIDEHYFHQSIGYMRKRLQDSFGDGVLVIDFSLDEERKRFTAFEKTLYDLRAESLIVIGKGDDYREKIIIVADEFHSIGRVFRKNYPLSEDEKTSLLPTCNRAVRYYKQATLHMANREL